MTVQRRPLIKLDVRISRIQLSGPIHFQVEAPRTDRPWHRDSPIKRHLKLSNGIWGSYPARPAIPITFASPARIETSAPARRFTPLVIVSVHAFSGDSESSAGRRRLVGPAHLCFGLEPFGSASRGFPALTATTVPDVLSTLTPPGVEEAATV